MRTLKIYFLNNFQIYDPQCWIQSPCCTLYPVLIYLRAGNFYLFTTFIRFPLLVLLPLGNCKWFLFLWNRFLGGFIALKNLSLMGPVSFSQLLPQSQSCLLDPWHMVSLLLWNNVSIRKSWSPLSLLIGRFNVLHLPISFWHPFSTFHTHIIVSVGQHCI